MLDGLVKRIFFDVLTPAERDGMAFVGGRPMVTARNLLGLTVRQAAERYGVGPSYMNRLEKHKTTDTHKVEAMMREDLMQVFLPEEIVPGPVVDPGEPLVDADITDA